MLLNQRTHLYEHGKGVESSTLIALAWYGLAAEYGYPGANEEFLRLCKQENYDDFSGLDRLQHQLLNQTGEHCN